MTYCEKYGNTGKKINYVVDEYEGALICISNNKEKKSFLQSLKELFAELFLPHGFPASVSSDYLEYQLWDTIQAFCSTISSIFTTYAILKGVGVGDSASTPLAATLTWILKDGTGMIGRILFAWWKGCMLDAECKKWRLAADIINDLAMVLELTLNVDFFKNGAQIILCISTALKAVVGVAGGATRAAITQHQAIRGNMGDVSAKDGSQETCVNLVASFVGLYIITHFGEDPRKIWCLFILITGLHLYSNYKAVKSLNMKTLNVSRYNILISSFFNNFTVLSPEVVNRRENVFIGFGNTDICGRKIHLGSSIHDAKRKCKIKNGRISRKVISTERYMSLNDDENLYVIIHENANETDVIESYFHAVIRGMILSNEKDPMSLKSEYERNLYYKSTETKEYISKLWIKFFTGIVENGWIVDRHQLPVDEWRASWDSSDFTMEL